ncbi:MAG: glycosyltransferase [Oligoflexia bacterium]|nr:glycosyltransferase [Oligoflexia bacterium]
MLSILFSTLAVMCYNNKITKLEKKLAMSVTMNKIKVLHTMTWLAPGGGVDIEVYFAIRGLLEEEFDVHFLVGSEVHHNPFLELKKLKFLVCDDLVRPIQIFKDLKALWFIYKLIRKERYDIVHTHETKASLLTRVAAWLAGSRCIIYGLHGVSFNDPRSIVTRLFYRWLEKSTVWMAHHIVFVGQDAVECYHRAKIGNKIPYTIIYPGIDVNKFISPSSTSSNLREKLGIANNDILIINIGRFSFAKAQKYTILIFYELSKQYANIRLLFVGEGDCREACIGLSKELGIEEKVIFHPFTSDVPSLLHIADISVITSLREGQPRVVVEASLCKVPTVGFDVEGIKEIIKNDYSGFIVPQYDVTALTEKIKILIDNPEKRRIFAERAFEHTKINWDYNIMVDKTKELYSHLMSPHL